MYFLNIFTVFYSILRVLYSCNGPLLRFCSEQNISCSLLLGTLCESALTLLISFYGSFIKWYQNVNFSKAFLIKITYQPKFILFTFLIKFKFIYIVLLYSAFVQCCIVSKQEYDRWKVYNKICLTRNWILEKLNCHYEWASPMGILSRSDIFSPVTNRADNNGWRM